jgi:colicin import membrane protein
LALQPQKVGYGISVGGHVLLVVAGLVGFLTSPTKVDEGESVPVEIVSDEPAQSTRGDRRGEQTPTPQRVVDRQTPEERQTPDPATLPVARERVQTADVPPPPPPRPAQADPRPPEPPQPPRQAQAAPPPPPVPVPQPAPRPTPAAAAAQEREDQAAKEAELLAQQKREEERRQQEQQRQAEARRQQEIRERQQREARERQERQEREQREAREKQEREQRERLAREQRERQQREARERAERQRQEQANARRFDPNSIAQRLATSSAQENDRRQASRTEATGATAPARTASLGTATGASSRITGREVDAIRAWAERCWEIPIAAREGNSPAVRLRVSFNRDGTVTARPEVQNPRGDASFQILANSAVRAVMRCSQEGGVRLPPERYDTWREVVLNFDPKEMMR